MVQWYFPEIGSFEAEIGHKTEFAVMVEGREYVHQWEVTDVDPNRRISYRWRYKDLVGEGAVTWELGQRGAGSILRLTYAGIGTFPQDDPAFTQESCENGWRYFINERLRLFVAGRFR